MAYRYLIRINGPSGSGKTTLARLLLETSHRTYMHFEKYNYPKLKEIKQLIKEGVDIILVDCKDDIKLDNFARNGNYTVIKLETKEQG